MTSEPIKGPKGKPLTGDQAIAHLQAELAEREQEIAMLREAAKPKRLGGKRLKVDGGAAVPLFLLSDWHVGESGQIAGEPGQPPRNVWSPEIAEQRAERLFAVMSWRLEQWARTWDTSHVAIGALGDFISGHIHEDLVEVTLPPVVEVRLASRLLGGGIRALLDRAERTPRPIRKLTIVCTDGNHGKTTKKIRVQTRTGHSWETSLYFGLAAQFASDPRVQFKIADDFMVYEDLAGHRIRFTHGDSINYQGGIGGLAIPLGKAIPAWDADVRADLTVMGHWHTARDFGHTLVNGSLIGFTRYSRWIKAPFERPAQVAALLHPRFGKQDVGTIYAERPPTLAERSAAQSFRAAA